MNKAVLDQQDALFVFKRTNIDSIPRESRGRIHLQDVKDKTIAPWLKTAEKTYYQGNDTVTSLLTRERYVFYTTYSDVIWITIR